MKYSKTWWNTLKHDEILQNLGKMTTQFKRSASQKAIYRIAASKSSDQLQIEFQLDHHKSNHD